MWSNVLSSNSTLIFSTEEAETHCLKITQNVAFDIFNFGIIHHFFPIKSDLSGNTVCKLQTWQNWLFLAFFINVNVARFARNVECDFFCDFQTLCESSKRRSKTDEQISKENVMDRDCYPLLSSFPAVTRFSLTLGPSTKRNWFILDRRLNFQTQKKKERKKERKKKERKKKEKKKRIFFTVMCLTVMEMSYSWTSL